MLMKVVIRSIITELCDCSIRVITISECFMWMITLSPNFKCLDSVNANYNESKKTTI